MEKLIFACFILCISIHGFAYETGLIINANLSPFTYSEFKKEKGTVKSTYSGYSYGAELGYGFGRLSLLGSYRQNDLKNRYEDSDEKRKDTDYGLGFRFFYFPSLYSTFSYLIAKSEMTPYEDSDSYKFTGKKVSVDLGCRMAQSNYFAYYISMNFIPWANYNKKDEVEINRAVKEFSYSLWLGLGVNL